MFGPDAINRSFIQNHTQEYWTAFVASIKALAQEKGYLVTRDRDDEGEIEHNRYVCFYRLVYDPNGIFLRFGKNGEKPELKMFPEPPRIFDEGVREFEVDGEGDKRCVVCDGESPSEFAASVIHEFEGYFAD